MTKLNSVDKTVDAYELTRKARDSALTMIFSAATALVAPLAFSYFTASSLDRGETFVITVVSTVSVCIFVRAIFVAVQLSREMSDTEYLRSLAIARHTHIYLLKRMLGFRVHAA